MKTIILYLTILSAISSVFAQNNPASENRNLQLYLSSGIDPTWNLKIGYQYGMKLFDKEILLFGEWIPSVVRIGFKNWDSKLGVKYVVYRKHSFMLFNTTYISPGRVNTRNFRSYRFSAGDRMLLGLFNQKRFLAISAEYKKNILSHMTHTDFYKETFYDDVKDGWYKSTGGLFQFGIEGGFALSSKIDMSIELKVPFTEYLQGLGGSPAHINIGFGYRIPD